MDEELDCLVHKLILMLLKNKALTWEQVDRLQNYDEPVHDFVKDFKIESE